MSETDAQQRNAPLQQVAAELHGMGQTGRVTRPVGQHDALGRMAQHVVDARILAHKDHLSAATAQRSHLVQLDAVVNHHDARTTKRIRRPGERYGTMQRRVERLRERLPRVGERDCTDQVLVADERRPSRGLQLRIDRHRLRGGTDATQGAVITQVARQGAGVDAAQPGHTEAQQLLLE